MKKLLTGIFSVAVAVMLAVSSTNADTLLKKAGGKASTNKATTTMQAKKAPQKSAKKGVKGLASNKSRTLGNGLRSEKSVASNVKTTRSILKAEGNYPEIYGGVLYSAAWEATGNSDYGIYTIPTSAGGSFEKLYSFNDISPNYGAAVKDGVYYFNYYYSFLGFWDFFESYGFDLETGEQVFYSDNTNNPILAQGMDTDPVTGEIYGIFMDDSLEGLELATVSYGSNSVTKTSIASLGDAWFNAFAIASDGTFYAIKTDDFTGEGILVTINRTTGAVTEIGDTGETPYYISGACIDRKTNRMFWALSPEDETGYLTEVDLTTGQASLVCMFGNGEEVAGMYIPVAAAADDAPDACTDVSVNFSADSLTGQVNFTTPTTTFGGAELETMVTVHILVNGEEVKTSEGLAVGTTDYENVTVEEAGLYNFTVYASNEAGDGPKVTVKNIWVGADTPAATKATAAYANGNMEITWLPVTEGINGGYVSDITYTVKDSKGNVLAEGLTVTSYSFAVEMPVEITAYYYEVYVVSGDLTSAPARTNTVMLGSIVPPYAPDFSTDGLEGWTVIDGNEDGKIWTVQSDGSVRMSYNDTLDMDDWLITPPLKLEAGKGYMVSFATKAQSTTFPEKLEVMWGDNNTPEALTNVILAPTDVNLDAYYEYSKMIIPETDGIYYVGFHGISDADEYYLYLKDIQIGEGVSTSAPGLPTNLVGTPGAGGALECTVAFNAPAVTMAGNALASLEKVELYRNETLINTFDAPTPGAALSFKDTAALNGYNNYSVVGYNADGKGLTASISVYVGFSLPVAPAVVNISRTDVVGQALVTWPAVTEDINGMTLTSNDVTYTVCVYDNGWVPVVEDLTALQYSYQAVAAGEQEFVQMAVFAETAAGTGMGTASDMIPVGTPYNGMNETFADGQLQYIWGYSQIGSASLKIGTDSTFEGITSVNGDNGYLYVNANYEDYGANLFSGLISLNGMVNPGLTFYTYNVVNEGGDPDINEIAVSVKEADSDEWVTVMAPTTVDELCGGVTDEWGKVTVSLAAYANKTIQVQLTAVTKFYTNTFFDDIKVGSILGHDLAAAGISAPGKVKAGAEYSVDVKVSNEGAQDAASYSVELYANEELVATEDCENLESGKSTVVSFDLTMSAIATEEITYYAKVVYSLDENEANNQTSSITVVPVVSVLPTATDLVGELTEDGIELTWNEPNLEGGVAEEITDDFEDAEGFASEYGDWKFYDGDQSEVGGFQNMDLPGITPGETKGSFWIWDNDIAQGNQTFEAHSGTHYLFALFRWDDGTSDDWAISPELYGGAQTISFYARSYSTQYPEKIQVYYSTGSQDVADFVAVSGSLVNAVPGDWTQYTVDLPEGAKYFAIRSFATSSFMLMVDDVTYTPAGLTADLEIAGYNIYRNGVKINDELVEETTYVDTTADENETYTYVVTVVYTDKGESAASNEVTVKTTSVNAINGGLVIAVENQTIVVRNAGDKEVSVYTPAGLAVYNGKGDARVEVSGGIYLVKVGKAVKKVIVK